jgi:hypothetical protein
MIGNSNQIISCLFAGLSYLRSAGAAATAGFGSMQMKLRIKSPFSISSPSRICSRADYSIKYPHRIVNRLIRPYLSRTKSI